MTVPGRSALRRAAGTGSAGRSESLRSNRTQNDSSLEIWRLRVWPRRVPQGSACPAGESSTKGLSLLRGKVSEMIAAANGLGQDIVLYFSSHRINTVSAILMVVAAAVTTRSVVESRPLVWQQT